MERQQRADRPGYDVLCGRRRDAAFFSPVSNGGGASFEAKWQQGDQMAPASAHNPETSPSL